MRVGIVFKVAKICIILRNQLSQKPEHIAFHVRVCVFIYRQTARRVLREKNAQAFRRVLSAYDVFYFARDVNHFLSLNRVDSNNLHKTYKKIGRGQSEF